MLTRLKITNFLLVKQLELDFKVGLTAVTGETGSGKSIIIDGLLLVFGARASADIIRIGQQQATFEAEFSISNQGTLIWLKENDLADLDNLENIICRRILDKNGRNKIYINGNSVTVSQIKALGELILDVHTQHASITLLKSDIQRNLLDEYVQIVPEVKKIGVLYKSIYNLESKLSLAISMQADLEKQREDLQVQINEFDDLNLKDNEWEDLEARHKELVNAGTILTELHYVQSILYNQDNSIIDNVNKMQSRLIRISEYVPKIADMMSLIDNIESEIQELSHNITTVVDRIDQDPHELGNIEVRMNQIFGIAQKYRINPENITLMLAELKQKLEDLTSDSNIEALTVELQDKKELYLKIAKEISAKRQMAAQNLSKQVTEILHQLVINGEFVIQVTSLSEFSEYGLESIDYQVCFNKGLPLQSLAKVASGGELSRVALALYLLLSVHNPSELIVFDEIDVGVGGKIAAIIGQMMAELGQSKQLICITHQPQVASFARNQLLVKKVDIDNMTQATANYLSYNDRVNEIARMLGGIDITVATLNHAREMLTTGL